VTTLEGSLTGALIAEKLEDMLLNWKISKEIVHLVYTSNMDSAMKDADIVNFGCFAYTVFSYFSMMDYYVSEDVGNLPK